VFFKAFPRVYPTENGFIEINIDNTGDNVEDLYQAIKKGDKMYFFGPYAQEQLEHQVQLNQCGIWKCCDI
jgi:hypothetical protein